MGNIFLGTYHRSLDEKGRLQIPSKLESQEKESFYILRGLDGCIAIYPEEGFATLLTKMKSMNFLSEKERAFIRLTSSSASKSNLDSHGRLLLGKDLLNDYGMGSDVTIIGVIDHFEIWDPVKYAKYLLKNSLSYENIAEAL